MKTEIGVRFAARNKQVHLIGLGEVVACLGRNWRALFSGPGGPEKTSLMGTTPMWENG